MAKRNKSSVLIASNLGRRALVFDEDEVVRLLRAASGEVSSLMVGASHLLRVPLSAGGALECWGFRLMPSMAGKEESRPHC
jgi:hypothetical protein